MKYPDAVDPSLVGTYPASAHAGGGYVWDAVLEYRVWCHPERGASDLAEGSEHLRSETALGVLQEIYALSLGHFAVRAMMAQAAATEQLDPDRLSFTGCLQILKCRLPECTAYTREDLQVWYEVMLWEMCRERTDDAPRRNRINPRVVRQKMSKFKKKRPEHSGLPPLQKTFAETVVVLR